MKTVFAVIGCVVLLQGCALKSTVTKAKHEAYLYADQLLIQAKFKSCEEIEKYVDDKRVELKQRMGEK